MAQESLQDFKQLWLRFFTAALCGFSTDHTTKREDIVRYAADAADKAVEEYKRRFL